MKVISSFIAAAFISIAATAQQPPANAIDPNAPQLTLEEKIALTTDEVKKADILEKYQKQFLAELKPIQDHEDAAKAEIEKAHPGWTLENGQNGWRMVAKKAEPPKSAEPAKK